MIGGGPSRPRPTRRTPVFRDTRCSRHARRRTSSARPPGGRSAGASKNCCGLRKALSRRPYSASTPALPALAP
eukprot:5358571-Lingulodinium_polyedra.AAC.1